MYRLARDLGYTVHDLTASLGMDELGYWMAYYEQFEPHLAADRRAAKVAFFAANTFAKPVRWPEMAENFGVQGGASRLRAQQLQDLPAVLDAIGAGMPHHIRERFAA